MYWVFTHVINIYITCTNIYFYRFSNYIMYWVFSKLFNHLYVQRSHVNMLLEAQKVRIVSCTMYLILLYTCPLSLSLCLFQKGIPIIFLPSHKSHVDYILITFVLVNSGIKVSRNYTHACSIPIICTCTSTCNTSS